MATFQQTRGKWDDDDFEVSPEHLIPSKMLYDGPKPLDVSAHSDSLLYFPILKGTKDATTGVEIKEGDIVVDFIRARSCWHTYESEADRYYLESSFNTLLANESKEDTSSWEGRIVGVSRFRAKYF